MGISTGGSKGRQRSEINVTPLVDIVLVLLIIFLVTMPIMMKQVTLEVPRKADLEHEEVVMGKQITILLKATGDVVLSDGEKDTVIHGVDLATTLRPMLDSMKNEKLIFVDFCNTVQWREVVSTMDQIRSLSSDTKNHDDIKVALKMREKDTNGEPLINPEDGCPRPAEAQQ
jgi:biopolymer transport protein ExbD